MNGPCEIISEIISPLASVHLSSFHHSNAFSLNLHRLQCITQDSIFPKSQYSIFHGTDNKISENFIFKLISFTSQRQLMQFDSVKLSSLRSYLNEGKIRAEKNPIYANALYHREKK